MSPIDSSDSNDGLAKQHVDMCASQSTAMPCSPTVLVELHKAARCKLLEVSCSTTVRDIIHKYGEETGWQLQRADDGNSIFEGCCIGELLKSRSARPLSFKLVWSTKAMILQLSPYSDSIFLTSLLMLRNIVGQATIQHVLVVHMLHVSVLVLFHG